MKDFKKMIAEMIEATKPGLTLDTIQSMIETPPDPHMGDYAFPCFRLAKVLKKAPPLIAEDIRQAIKKEDFVQKCEVMGAYLNFFIDTKYLAEEVIGEVLEKGDRFGSNESGKGRRAIVEYSSTNIAKPFHIGHIRSTIIGSALDKILRFNGYETRSVNYLGDYGTQFGMMIAAYLKWGDEEKLNENPIGELLRLYVKYNELCDEDENAKDEAREWFNQLENKNPQAVQLWARFKELSLREFNRVYDLLGVHFDSYDGEAYHSRFIPEVLRELEEKGLLVESEGAKIIDLSEENLPPVLIIKSNGSSTYITRDIATAIYRKKDFHFDRNIYVVGSQQLLHFQQLRAILKKMGYEWWQDCVHVPFGMISMKDGTMATRKGKVIFLEDVLKKACEKTEAIIEERNPQLEDRQQVAKEVGIGAVIFQELFNNRIKDYVFDWDELLNFEGETGPYVQYAHARAHSILRKGDFSLESQVDLSLLSTMEEANLLRRIYEFPEYVKVAAQMLEPSMLTRQLVEIAQAFNKFYGACPIHTAEENLRKARLLLTHVTRSTLATGLGLLGLASPDKM